MSRVRPLIKAFQALVPKGSCQMSVQAFPCFNRMGNKTSNKTEPLKICYKMSLIKTLKKHLPCHHLLKPAWMITSNLQHIFVDPVESFILQGVSLGVSLCKVLPERFGPISSQRYGGRNRPKDASKSWR